MAWLKIETHTPDKPEVFDIAGILGISPDETFGRLFRVWAWFDAHTTNGKANGISVSEALIDRVAGVSGFADAMYQAGWLEDDRLGYAMTKFDVHNGESSKKRALTAKRVAKHAEKANANTNATSVSSALPREEKIREEVNQSTALSGKPDGVTLSGVKQKFKEEAEGILAFLNEKAGKRFPPTKANLDFISGRLKDGATSVECRQVIAMKCREWLGDAENKKYLRPATLFNATKFSQYVGELGSSE